MCIWQWHDVKCAAILCADGTPLSWADSIRHLGVFIVWSCKFQCSFERSFFRSVNALFCKLGRSASEDVFLHLVNSKRFPILLYCLEVCPLTKSDLQSLDFTVTRLLVKLFQASNIGISTNVAHTFISSYPVKYCLWGLSTLYVNYSVAIAEIVDTVIML